MKRVQPYSFLKPVESLCETTHRNKQTTHMCSAVGIIRIQCYRLLIVPQSPSVLLLVQQNIAKQKVDAVIGSVKRQRLSRQSMGALQCFVRRNIPPTYPVDQI